MKDFDPNIHKPPTNVEFETLIINDYGHCDLIWKKIYFDSILPSSNDFKIYDENDKYIGKIWRWRHLNERN